jgi:VWFA-related protein
MAPGRKLLYGFVLIAAVLSAQAPAPATQKKTISLNVIVRDNHDQPVGDLGVDDFQVTDQGKAQRITVYGPEQRRLLAAPPGSHEDSKRVAPHTVVILFDVLNANMAYRSYGADEIVRSVQKLEASDSIYLYLLTNSGALYPVHGLPGPDADVHPVDGPWTQQIKPRLDAALHEVFGLKPIDDKVPTLLVQTTYRAIEAMASGIAGMPGRKDIIWVTHGVPIVVRLIDREPFEYLPQLQRLATAIDRAGVAINTVDQGDALATGSKETIEQFASVTGGKAYPSGTFDTALTQVLEAPKATYLVEYAAPEPDGKFHKVRVTTSRKGVRIQAEQGYVASK